jgi:hypothetical protein
VLSATLLPETELWYPLNRRPGRIQRQFW